MKEKIIGESLVVLCKSADLGEPKTTLKWYKDGVIVPSNLVVKPAQLSISAVKRDTTGNYTCKGGNEIGEISKTFEFKTIGKGKYLFTFSIMG